MIPYSLGVLDTAKQLKNMKQDWQQGLTSANINP